MSIKLREGTNGVQKALVAQFNALLVSGITTEFHATKTALPADQSTDPPSENPLLVTLADATDLATAVALVNQIKAYGNTHLQDSVAHDSAVTSPETTADATDLATGIALANAWKATYNAHLSEANVHYNNDATNTIAAADATDLASLQTLVNEAKADLNAHMAGAYAAAAIVELVQA